MISPKNKQDSPKSKLDSPKHEVANKSENMSTTSQTQSQSKHQQLANPVVDDRLDNFFGFDRFANDIFHELDRISERFGFPSSRISHPFLDELDHFERRISKMMEPFRNEFGVLRNPSPLFRHDNEIFNHTQRLFDKFSNTHDEQREGFKPDEPDVELLSHPRELEDLYKRYKADDSEGRGVVSGKSYASSTIYKNGKAVTVSRHSELTPEGVINTKLDQKFTDEAGHDQAHSWKKRFELKNNNQQNMIKEDTA